MRLRARELANYAKYVTRVLPFGLVVTVDGHHKCLPLLSSCPVTVSDLPSQRASTAGARPLGILSSNLVWDLSALWISCKPPLRDFAPAGGCAPCLPCRWMQWSFIRELQATARHTCSVSSALANVLAKDQALTTWGSRQQARRHCVDIPRPHNLAAPQAQKRSNCHVRSPLTANASTHQASKQSGKSWATGCQTALQNATQQAPHVPGHRRSLTPRLLSMQQSIASSSGTAAWVAQLHGTSRQVSCGAHIKHLCASRTLSAPYSTRIQDAERVSGVEYATNAGQSRSVGDAAVSTPAASPEPASDAAGVLLSQSNEAPAPEARGHQMQARAFLLASSFDLSILRESFKDHLISSGSDCLVISYKPPKSPDTFDNQLSSFGTEGVADKREYHSAHTIGAFAI